MLNFENSVRSVDSKDGEVITFNTVPITGYIDDLVQITQQLSEFVKTTSGRNIRGSEWEAIFHQVILKAKV